MDKTKIELKSIGYKSSIFLGIFLLIIYFILGIVQLVIFNQSLSKIPEYASMASIVSPLNMLVVSPIIAGLAGLVISFAAILIYNLVAKKFPISWEIKK